VFFDGLPGPARTPSFGAAPDLHPNRRAGEPELLPELIDEEPLVRKMERGRHVGEEDEGRRRDNLAVDRVLPSRADRRFAAVTSARNLFRRRRTRFRRDADTRSMVSSTRGALAGQRRDVENPAYLRTSSAAAPRHRNLVNLGPRSFTDHLFAMMTAPPGAIGLSPMAASDRVASFASMTSATTSASPMATWHRTLTSSTAPLRTRPVFPHPAVSTIESMVPGQE
jgi:hypothetical protein